MGSSCVTQWFSSRVSAALTSTVLSPAIEFAFTAGHVVATRRAAVPGFVGLVVVAVSGARFVDGPGGFVHPTASLSPCLANRDKRGNANSPGDSEKRPQDRRGHEGQPVAPKPNKNITPHPFSHPHPRAPSSRARV